MSLQPADGWHVSGLPGTERAIWIRYEDSRVAECTRLKYATKGAARTKINRTQKVASNP